MPNVSRTGRTFVLLAPAFVPVLSSFTQVETDVKRHSALLCQLQRLRGGVYLSDGAIEPWQLTTDGRHCLRTDDFSWHVLTVQEEQVLGCARLQVYDPTVDFSELGVAQSSQSQCPMWGETLRHSVTAELERARSERMSFAEAGGWALAPELRCTTEALHIALASYAIGELLGGCLGLSTATVRHSSSSILRRLGGTSFSWEGRTLPRYYDPAYRCEMELVRFDSRAPNPRYQSLVDQLRAQLPQCLVLCPAGMPASTQSLLSMATAVGAQAVVNQVPHADARDVAVQA